MATPCSSSNRRNPTPATAAAPGLPFVRLNLALSADGRIATANHAVHTFGSNRDRQHFYQLRAQADAILCGARTVAATRATLGPGPTRYRQLRRARGLADAPIRIVASGRASLDPSCPLLQTPGGPVIVLITRQAPAERVRRLEQAGAQVVAFGSHQLDFPAALRWLSDHHRVRHLLVEGGGELNQSLLRAGLVRELHLTLCPLVLGGSRAPTLADGQNPLSLAEATNLRLTQLRRSGAELFAVFEVLPTR